MPQLDVQSVSQMISQVAVRYIESPGEAQHSPVYVAALGAVLSLLERHASGSPDIAEAVTLARRALDAMQCRAR